MGHSTPNLAIEILVSKPGTSLAKLEESITV